MKQVVNFRLSNRAITALSMLQNKMHLSKTAVIEEALQLYAKQKLRQEDKLFEFAGILTDKEAENLLNTVSSNKMDKDIEDLDL